MLDPSAQMAIATMICLGIAPIIAGALYLRGRARAARGRVVPGTPSLVVLLDESSGGHEASQ